MKKLAVILLLIAFGTVSFIPLLILEVRTTKNQNLIYQQLAKTGDEFSICWTHSVTLQPVIETYKLEAPGEIPLVRMVFDDFGPNLPAHPEFDQRWAFDKGKIIVTNYDRVFEKVPVTIGAVIANHSLSYNNKKVVLAEKFRPGGLVEIGLVKKSLANYLISQALLFVNPAKSSTMITK